MARGVDAENPRDFQNSEENRFHTARERRASKLETSAS
jgi:hypothetical protein